MISSKHGNLLLIR